MELVPIDHEFLFVPKSDFAQRAPWVGKASTNAIGGLSDTTQAVWLARNILPHSTFLESREIANAYFARAIYNCGFEPLHEFFSRDDLPLAIGEIEMASLFVDHFVRNISAMRRYPDVVDGALTRLLKEMPEAELRKLVDYKFGGTMGFDVDASGAHTNVRIPMCETGGHLALYLDPLAVRVPITTPTPTTLAATA